MICLENCYIGRWLGTDQHHSEIGFHQLIKLIFKHSGKQIVCDKEISLIHLVYAIDNSFQELRILLVWFSVHICNMKLPSFDSSLITLPDCGREIERLYQWFTSTSNITFEYLYEYQVYQGCGSWICSIYIDISSRHIQLENLVLPNNRHQKFKGMCKTHLIERHSCLTLFGELYEHVVIFTLMIWG